MDASGCAVGRPQTRRRTVKMVSKIGRRTAAAGTAARRRRCARSGHASREDERGSRRGAVAEEESPAGKFQKKKPRRTGCISAVLATTDLLGTDIGAAERIISTHIEPGREAVDG